MAKKPKQFTLPIGCEPIYEALAEISWKHIGQDAYKDKNKYIAKIKHELAEEAILHSFTPSGEIKSGTTRTNPVNRNVINIYYGRLFDSMKGLLYSFTKDFYMTSNEERNEEIVVFRNTIKKFLDFYSDNDYFDIDQTEKLLKKIVAMARANEDYVKRMGHTKANRFAEELLKSVNIVKRIKKESEEN